MAEPLVDSPDQPCISLYSPWAWAMMYANKDVENRGPAFARTVTGRVWVHASRWPDLKTEWTRLDRLHEEFGRVNDILARLGTDCPSRLTLRILDEMRGHIVGSIEVTGYADLADSAWFSGAGTAVLLRDPRPLAKPVAAKGAVSWWRPSQDVKLALRQQLEAA